MAIDSLNGEAAYLRVVRAEGQNPNCWRSTCGGENLQAGKRFAEICAVKRSLEKKSRGRCQRLAQEKGYRPAYGKVCQ